MQQQAQAAGVQVMMGFNKNAAKNVQKALVARQEALSRGENPVVCFQHGNDFTPETMPECVRRNSEGLLRNMACHEIALAVSLFNINPRNMKSVTVDRENSELIEIDGMTDFTRVAFTLENNDGEKVKIL